MSADWFRFAENDDSRPDDSRHLAVLRELLRRDYLTGADWTGALADLSSMVAEAVRADKALVALWMPSRPEWWAITAAGESLSDAEIRSQASLSVLESVRGSGQPLLATGDRPLELESETIALHQLESVLAVPIFWWDVGEERRERHFGGCLYAHRAGHGGGFSQADVAIVLDLAEIAQRTLNVLRHLQNVEKDLALSRARLRELEQAQAQRYRLGDFETEDPHFARTVLQQLQRIAHADRVGLLLVGPTGSGKSHLARAFHYAGRRQRGPFITLDCSQVTSPETLAAELFGYSPSSGYANAPTQGRLGKAALADGGSLFIDEISALPLDLQQRLLRLIQDGVFSPLGSAEERRVSVQIIAASNANLPVLVRDGRFREDLYYRISVVRIPLPPLSHRVRDIPPLSQRFLEETCQQMGRDRPLRFSPAALRKLQENNWALAGNIRGLRHTVERSVLLADPDAEVLDPDAIRIDEAIASFAAWEVPAAPAAPLEQPRRRGTRLPLARITAAIREHGSAVAAARALDVSYDALYWRLRKAGTSVHAILAGAEESS
ncbi:MAG: sigma 54-interacting transcriptional regulator [Candidatus Schekmanbacteria bacterium]|nr:sigma 54-interacting transcriptional regulator [Candidatus Schekmanbacteria bacterium]